MAAERPTTYYGYKVYRDTNPNSPTYNELKYERDPSLDEQCNNKYAPNWVKQRVVCSTSRTEIIEKTDPTVDGYNVAEYLDTNPNSPTYNQKKYQYESVCSATESKTANWVDTGNVGCSTSSSSYVSSTKGQYGFKEQRDNNQYSDTHNQTRWIRNTAGDNVCAEAIKPRWEATEETACSTSSTEYLAAPEPSVR